MRRVERQSVEPHATDFHARLLLVQQMNIRAKITMGSVIKKSIVVATDQYCGNACVSGACQLRDQKCPGLQIWLVIIKDVASENQCIDSLRDCQVNNANERVPTCLFQIVTQIWIAHRGRADWRPKMNVG